MEKNNLNTRAFLTIDFLENGGAKLGGRILDPSMTREQAIREAILFLSSELGAEVIPSVANTTSRDDDEVCYYVKRVPGRANCYGPEYVGVDGTPRPLGDARIYTDDDLLRDTDPDADYHRLPSDFSGQRQEWVLWWHQEKESSACFLGSRADRKQRIRFAKIYTEIPFGAEALTAIELPQFSRQKTSAV